MKNFYFILLALCTAAATNFVSPASSDIVENTSFTLTDFVAANGWKYLVLALPHCIQGRKLVRRLLADGPMTEVRTTCKPVAEYLNATATSPRTGTPTIAVLSDLTQLSGVLAAVKPHRVVVLFGEDGPAIERLSEHLKTVDTSAAFYLASSESAAATPLDGNFRFHLIHTFKNDKKASWNEVKLLRHRPGYLRTKVTVDMGGARILSNAITYRPYQVISGCEEGGKDCEATGPYAELTEVLETMFNFTMQVDEDPSGSWGARPATGEWSDPNATFSGLTGDLVNGKYELTYGPCWMWTWGRSFRFDFTPAVIPHPNTLAFNFREPAVDVTLLLRPFTPKAWVVLLMVLFVTLTAVHLLSMKVTEDFLSCRIAVISGWLFFILVNAFYGGALTMFFSSESSLPFLTLEKGSDEHPTWKFLHRDEHDTLILSYLKSDGTVGLPELIERVYSNRDEQVISTISEGLSRMATKPGTFMYTSTFALVEAFNNGNFPGLELKLFGEAHVNPTNFMMAADSPYKKIFSTGVNRMLRTGTVDIVLSKWLGRLPEAKQDGLKVLGGRHLALGFGAFIMVCLTCLVVLISEFAAKKLRTFFETQRIYEGGATKGHSPSYSWSPSDSASSTWLERYHRQ